MMHRRQKRQVVFAGFIAVVAVINVLFFFILLSPARSDYFNLQGNIDKLQIQLKASNLTLTRLQKTSEQLEKFDQDRDGLFKGHFIKFDPGFADLSPRLEDIAVRSGVLRPVVDFTRDEVKQYGLYAVKIKIPVTGTYANAVNFVKTLETSDMFFVIDSIELRSTSDPAGPPTAAGSVALSLTLETFFYNNK